MSQLLERLFKGGTNDRATPAGDRRVDARHAAGIDVLIEGRDGQSFPGTVINISLGGAAISVHVRSDGGIAEWLGRLDQNEELWLTGLIDTDVRCWVVVVDGHVLRVHFTDDDRFRDRLSDVIDRLPRV
jgi:PilZ domain